MSLLRKNLIKALFAGCRHRFWAILRTKFKPLHTLDDDEPVRSRSHERYKRASLTSLSSLATRGVMIATSLVAVPLVLRDLGPVRYGLWLTLSSFIACFSVADLGLSRGLINHFSAALGKEDLNEAAKLVSSALFTIVGFGVILALLFGCAYPFIPWARVFNVVDVVGRREAAPAVLILFCCWLIEWASKLFLRVNEGRQEGYINNLWQIGGRLLTLGAIVVGVENKAGLPMLVLIMAGTPLFANFAIAFHLMHRHKWLIPKLSNFVPNLVGRLLKTGTGYLGLDVSYLILMNAPYLLIANLKGAGAVTEFGIPLRAFAIVNMLVILLINPLWPAFIEATARGDHAWVRGAYKRAMSLTVGVALLPTLALIVWGKPIIRAWVGDSITPSMIFLVILGTWSFVFTVGNSAGVFLNGVGGVRISAWTQIVEAVVVVVLQIVFIPKYGIVGAALVLAVGDLLLRTGPRLFFCRRILKRTPSQVVITGGKA